MTTWEIIKLIGHILGFIIILPFWWFVMRILIYDIKELIRVIKEKEE